MNNGVVVVRHRSTRVVVKIEKAVHRDDQKEDMEDDRRALCLCLDNIIMLCPFSVSVGFHTDDVVLV